MKDKRKIGDISLWTGAISAIISVAVVVVGLFLWFDSKIETIVESKVEGYLNFWEAKNLVENEEYNDAIILFKESFKQFTRDGITEDELIDFIEPYLSAIVYSKETK